MAKTYCISDIHGEYEQYISLLKKINFNDSDTLYIIGDAIDRGKNSVKLLQDMMLRPNVIPLIGNYEYMAIHCLRFLMSEITEESISKLDENMIQGLLEWQTVGGQTMIDEFHRLSYEEKQDIMEYLEDFSLYEEVSCADQEFVLVHAGLDHFSKSKPLDDYKPYEILFHAPDYPQVYFNDKLLVTGHLPTSAIEGNTKPNYIYKANNHIAIDCGCAFGGRLGAICLDTWEAFYSA